MTFQKEHNNEKDPRKMDWFPWLLVAVIAGLLIFNYIDPAGTTGISTSGYSWLSLLLFLICPFMMFFMMSGHGHGRHRDSSNNQENQNVHSGHGGCCGGQKDDKISGQ